MGLQKTHLNHMVIALVAVKLHLMPLLRGSNPVLSHLLNSRYKAPMSSHFWIRHRIREVSRTLFLFLIRWRVSEQTIGVGCVRRYHGTITERRLLAQAVQRVATSELKS
jgi:hypothetical protein